MWNNDVDDSEFFGGGLVTPQVAYIKEYSKGKTMDSAKKSVEKILEIAKKHGYACVVGFKQSGTPNYDTMENIDMWCGATGAKSDVDFLVTNSIEPVLDHYRGNEDGE